MTQTARGHVKTGFRSLWILVSTVACLLAGNVRADGVGADCVRQGGMSGNLVYQYFPGTAVLLPNTTPVGGVFGPWITSSDSAAWRCTPLASMASGNTLSLSVQGYPPYVREGNVVVDGDTYAVYQTNDATLAYIARWRFSARGQMSDWQPLTIHPGGQQDHPESFSIPYNGGQSFNLGVDVQIRFVKRTGSLSPGVVTIVDPMYVRHSQRLSSGLTSVGSGTYRIAQLKPSTVNIVAGGTCTTPDVHVELPPVPASTFSGLGTIASTTPFSLNFRNCPAGLNRLGYSFAPTTSVLNAANAVVALDGTSTASGVGIQLANGQGVPINFGTIYTLSNYNPNQIRNYSVPLEASLFQTDPTVSGGSVSSAVTFTLDYR